MLFISEQVAKIPDAILIRVIGYTELRHFVVFLINSKQFPDDNRIKKEQLDAQLILSIFRQPLHVSEVSRPIIRRYNRMYSTFGTNFSF
jgi:hypothetical protein